MATAATEPATEPLYVLAVGRTGVGKSTSLGTIVQDDSVFPVGMGLKSKTRICKSANVRDLPGIIFDSPGFRDSELTIEDLHNQLLQGLKELTQRGKGVDVFLFFDRWGRYTQDEEEVFKEFEAMAGEGVLNHTIQVFTHAGTLTKQDTLKEIKKEGRPFLRDLVVDRQVGFLPWGTKEKAPVRFAVMGELTPDRRAQDRDDLIKEIRDLADSNKQANRHRFAIDRLVESLQWFEDQMQVINSINAPHRKEALCIFLNQVRKGAMTRDAFKPKLELSKAEDVKENDFWWSGVYGACMLGSCLAWSAGCYTMAATSAMLSVSSPSATSMTCLSATPLMTQFGSVLLGGSLGGGVGTISHSARHVAGVVPHSIKTVLKPFLKKKSNK